MQKRLKNFLRPFWNMNPWRMQKKIKRLERKYDDLYFFLNNQYLKKVSGVIHIGANIGQERFNYKALDLDVIWIEPIPVIYKKLSNNINLIPNQLALNYLITDKDDMEYELKVTDNEGMSSSIFDLHLHKEIWPEIKNNENIKIKSKTLETIFKEKEINLDKYQALIIDTQGSELLVLKGCRSILRKFKYIKTEASDFEVYKNCCQLKDIEKFMNENDFYRIDIQLFKEKISVGKQYDVLYKRR